MNIVTGVAEGWLSGWSQENSVPECDNYEEQWANIDLKCPLKAAAGNNTDSKIISLKHMEWITVNLNTFIR